MGDESRYLFGTIENESADLTIRLDYCLSPKLTVQYYAQPFFSAGSYALFKRITDPQGHSHHERFHEFAPDEIAYDNVSAEYRIDEDLDGQDDYVISNPDFNVQELNSNLVIRWEFNPGSALYLVWSQRRSGYADEGAFDLHDNVGDLFDTHPDDVFLLKVSYWIPL